MRFLLTTASLAALALTLTACGGGGDEDFDPVVNDETPIERERQGPMAAGDTRSEAAAATANSGSNACAAIRPFYWEIGNRDGRTASGSVASPGNKTRYTATTPVSLASASKWLYSAYAVQRKGGLLDGVDIKMLTMRSGYTSLTNCARGQTVQACLNSGKNGSYAASNDNRFFYNGGHMQKHATLNGLGTLNNAGLAAALHSQIGSDIPLAFSQPQLAGGAVATPDAYARFLRKLMRSELHLGPLLGTQTACASPRSCPSGQAVYAPLTSMQNWHYSLGHWVEDDPATGDGAFSSPGAFGFYPWIDAGKSTYGIVSRVVNNGAQESMACGSLIRKAWASGNAL